MPLLKTPRKSERFEDFNEMNIPKLERTNSFGAFSLQSLSSRKSSADLTNISSELKLDMKDKSIFSSLHGKQMK